MKNIITLNAILLISLASFAQAKQMIVAQDGSGQYKTVQAAFDAIPPNNKKPVTIFIKNGTYYEKLRLTHLKTL